MRRVSMDRFYESIADGTLGHAGLGVSLLAQRR